MGGRSGRTARTPGLTVVKRINAVRVTKEELVAFNEAVNQLPAADRSDFVSRALVAMEQHPGDHEKVSALMFRMEALARIASSDAARGWTFPEPPDGAVMTKGEMFAAAAEEPLREGHHRLSFNKARFLRRVLALATVDDAPH